MINQIDDLKNKVSSHLVSFQESLCSCLDVLDQRYCGNAKQMLLREDAAPVAPNLDMIGETPNPDDEETFRNNFIVPSAALSGSANAVDPFIIEE